MTRPGKYASFAELERHELEGRDYVIETVTDGRDCSIMVIAPHGGGIEDFTDQLAASIAGDDYGFYAFRGTKGAGNSALHITSRCFDEPTALRLVEHAAMTLAVHGKRGTDRFAMVGGRNISLVTRLVGAMKSAGLDVRRPPPEVAGQHHDNICNRSLDGGAQVELSKTLRDSLRRDTEKRRLFVETIRGVLAEFQRS